MQMAQQINDPSDKLAPQLQNHVHLLSNNRFPTIAHISVEQAFQYLINSPMVVKTVAPMSWTYLQQPTDGTIFLEWLSSKYQDQAYPSDGYVWGDPEATFQQEFSGYMVEMKVHTAGYRPGLDPTTAHARTRYRIIQKHPSVNAPPPDPCLWIVHYHPADPNRMMPVSQLPVTHQMRQTLNERRFLEQQGQLERKDFMLHDREHWPTINVPSSRMQAPGMYGGQNAMPGMQLPQHRQAQSQSYYPQPSSGAGQPPAKRQRQAPPSQAQRASESAMDTTIEDEENTALGDYFDHLTPRDISVARYSQHHRWMEEVFSSPYASGQIVPADLGLGLMGELKGLTEGIVEPPAVELIEAQKDKVGKPKEAQPFTNLKKEQLDEFNKRVDKHLADGQAEIQRMKEEHAAKMQEWKKTKTLSQAEKRLRMATWEGQEIGNQTLLLQASNGHTEGGAKESVEDVIKDVEAALGVRITSRKDATLVEKGGFEPEEPQEARRSSGMDMSNGLQAPGADSGNSSSMDFKQSPAPRTLGEQLDDKIPSNIPQPTFSPAPPQEQQQQQQQQQYQQPTQQANGPGNPLSQPPDLDTTDTFMDDMNMDLDAPTSDLQFDANAPHQEQQQQQQQQLQPPTQNDTTPASPLHPTTETTTTATTTSTAPTTTTTTATTAPHPTDPAAKAMETPSAAPGTTAAAANPAPINTNTNIPEPSPNTGGDLFNDDDDDDAGMGLDNTFDELANFGDGDGDADADAGVGFVDFGEGGFEGQGEGGGGGEGA